MSVALRIPRHRSIGRMNMRTEKDGIFTGNPGLDTVLRGGHRSDRLNLLDGSPGSGKTSLALQFQLAGRTGSQRVLYITLSATSRIFEVVAASHGRNLAGIDIFELSSADEVLGPGRSSFKVVGAQRDHQA
jgi:circadian clock protein KaiC